MKRLATLAALLLSGITAGAADRPNVIIFDICSARADHFGLYGYGRDTTPGIDAMGKESAVFENASTQSSWCLPNYASLFTGMTAEVHGRYTTDPGLRGPKELATLASKLQESGYETAAYTGGVYFLKVWGLEKGFDSFQNDFSTTTALPGRVGTYLPEAMRWVERRPAERPYFLYLSVDDLHAPYQSDEPERYDPGYEGIVHDTGTLNLRFYREFNLAEQNPRVLEFRKDPKHLRHLVAHYDAALRDVDRMITDFTDKLKKAGSWDNTIVIITADHGEMLGERAMLGHTEGLYQGVLHVPLLIHYPGVGGERLTQLTERVDLMPTLLEAAGVSAEGLELQGKSLVPVLKDPSKPLRDVVYASSKRNLPDRAKDDVTIDERIVRTAKWKLHFYLAKDHFELYDLETDPLETRDVSAEHPDVVSRLAFELEKKTEESRPHAPGPPGGTTDLSRYRTKLQQHD